MRSATRIIFVFVFAAVSMTANAATSDEVQKAYENCVVMRTEGTNPERYDSREAIEAYAVETCTKARDGGCPTPDGFFCDGFVESWLFRYSTLEDAERLNVTLPHTGFFEPPDDEYEWPSEG